MNIDIYTGGLAETNAYLVQTETSSILFDAPAGIYDWLESRDIKITHLLLTHLHWDHCHDVSFFKDVEILAFADHDEDLILQRSFKERHGIDLDIKPFQVTQKITHEQEINIADIQLNAYHVPGHSPDSLAFHCPEESMCIAGDVLFYQSCGRVDLPGGNGKQLVDSIEKIMFNLPEDTTIFPGHGPETTIEEEKKHNPYKTIA